MDIKDIVLIEKQDAENKLKDTEINREFYSDLNKVWKEYRVAKYGRILAPFYKYLFIDGLLFEVYYFTNIFSHEEYWFNKKWEIKVKSGEYIVTNLEKNTKFVIR